MTSRDKDGQPGSRYMNARLRKDRAHHGLLGLAAGMIADGKATEDEATILLGWMEANPDCLGDWPFNTDFREALTVTTI